MPSTPASTPCPRASQCCHACCAACCRRARPRKPCPWPPATHKPLTLPDPWSGCFSPHWKSIMSRWPGQAGAACLHHPGLLLGLRLLYNPQHVIEFSFLFCACTATGQGSSVQLMRVLSMNSCSIQNLLLNSTLTCASCHVRSQQQVRYVLSAVNVKTTWTKPPMDSRCQCFASDAQSHICLSLH